VLLKGLEMSGLESSLIVAAVSDHLGVPVTGGRQ
jgi:hypothetical protein